MAYVATNFVFGETPSAAKWNQLTENDAYFDSLIGSGTAWTSWTPTFANLTVGNGTHASKYQKHGKIVFYRMQFTLGSTSSVASNPTFTLPLTSISYSQAGQNIGQLDTWDSSPAGFAAGYVGWTTTTTAQPFVYAVSGGQLTNSGLASTVPFTWATGDKLLARGFYEAA